MVSVAEPAPRTSERSREVEGERGPELLERELLDGIGELEILRRLGAGAMGAVWLARDPMLEREVAVKLLRRGRHTAERARARMLREAQALARLRHPNVVAIHEVGTISLAAEEADAPPLEQMYLVMEYVEGPTLRGWAKLAPRSLPELLEVAIAAGRGLAAAHEAELVHGDFKPDNVLVGDDGRVKVVDFGLAFAAERGRKSGAIPSAEASAIPSAEAGAETGAALLRSSFTAVRGTPAYMSPEQLLGRTSTAKSDQFSFCVSLWELIHGCRPWPYDSLAKLREAAREQRLTPSQGDRKLPRWLDKALRRGMDADPEQRFESMSALVDELEQRPRLLRRRQRRGLIAVVGLIVIAASWQVGSHLAARERQAEAPSTCVNPVERMHATWSDERSERLRVAFAAASDEPRGDYVDEQWVRVSALLDRTRDLWIEQRMHVCGQLREQPADAELERRASCLEQQRASLDATLTVLERADAATVERALEIVDAVADPEACRDPGPLRIEAPSSREQAIELAAVRAEIARAEAEYRSEHPERATQILDALSARVAALDHIPVRAELELARGRVALSVDDHASAEQHLRAALDAAELSLDDRAALEAWADLLYLAAIRRRFDEARWIVPRGEVVLARLDRERRRVDPRLRAHWLNSRAVDYAMRADYEPAFELFEAAVAALDELPEGTATTRDPLSNLATIYLRADRAADAEATYRRSIARIEASFGEHPRLALPYLGLGNVYMDRDLAQAREAYLRALELWGLAAQGHRPRIALAEANLALVALSGGDWSSALNHGEQAAAIQREIYPSDHERLLGSELSMARALLAAGEIEAAAGELERIRASSERDPAHPLRDRLELALAELALVQGRLDAAESACMQALAAMVGTARRDPKLGGRAYLVRARVALARGLPELAVSWVELALEGVDGPRPGAGIELPRLRLALAEGRWGMVAGARPRHARDPARACTPEAQREAERETACTLLATARWQAELAVLELDAISPSPGRDDLLATIRAWLDAHPLPGAAGPLLILASSSRGR